MSGGKAGPRLGRPCRLWWLWSRVGGPDVRTRCTGLMVRWVTTSSRQVTSRTSVPAHSQEGEREAVSPQRLTQTQSPRWDSHSASLGSRDQEPMAGLRDGDQGLGKEVVPPLRAKSGGKGPRTGPSLELDRPRLDRSHVLFTSDFMWQVPGLCDLWVENGWRV